MNPPFTDPEFWITTQFRGPANLSIMFQLTVNGAFPLYLPSKISHKTSNRISLSMAELTIDNRGDGLVVSWVILEGR